ncbi:MAG: ribonuclease Z [Chloroflexi bacterium]|nr:ribonuclease Z [Chloroflexota bacterium]
MFEIVFFGTSASAPSIHRGLPAQAVIAGEYRFLIDCGEGTQRQILRSGIGFKRLRHILLTHGHLDHVLGLGGLVSTFANWENIDSLEIFGGRSTLERVAKLLFGVVLDYERIPIEIKLLELQPGLIFESKEFTVSAFPVTHRGSGNFGFVFQERSHRPFLVEKAQALGVPAGPERGQLVAGNSITLADGRVITPEMVLADDIRGAKLVYIGDIGRLDNVREFVRDADALVIEATFLEDDGENANAFGHITARQAATLALEMGVKTLILTHISRRYGEKQVYAEARSVFPNVYVARDLEHFVIHRDHPVEKLTPEMIRARNEANNEGSEEKDGKDV